jgi:peptide deformylase
MLPSGKRTLRTPCAEVTPTDDWVSVLQDLRDTLNAATGARGLAAPQIGSLLRIFVVCDGPRVLEFINPTITGRSIAAEGEREGCLSMPGFATTVWRPVSIQVETLRFGKETCRAEFNGKLARVVQHEYDHLDGILISQREAEYVANRK